MRVVVTGGAGFIGSNLVAYLVRQGHKVTVVDDLSSGKLENLGPLLDQVAFVRGNVATHTDLDAIVEECDLVFHLAAMVGVRTTIERPIETYEANTLESKRIFGLCLEYDVPVVFASSSEVYGLNTEMPISENAEYIFQGEPNNRWIYALSKLVAEAYCMQYARLGLKYVILRYFNCYGPNMTTGGYSSVVAKFFEAALEDEPITVFGDGSQTRSFIFVKDLVRATYDAGNCGIRNTTLNVGTQDEITILDLANKIRLITKSKAPIVFVDPKETLGQNFTETPKRKPAVTKENAILDFTPSTSLDDGLLTTYTWIQRAEKHIA